MFQVTNPEFKPSHFIVSISLLSFILVFVTGCLGIGEPNSRTVYYGNNIELGARLIDDEVQYHYISIGKPNTPFHQHVDDFADLAVQMPDGKFFGLDEITVELLKDYALKTRVMDTGNWEKGAQDFKISDHLSFVVFEDKILSMSAFTFDQKPKESPAVFKRKESNSQFILPFSHDEMLELMGEPDKISEGFHW